MLSASFLTCSLESNTFGRLCLLSSTPPTHIHMLTQEFPGVERIVSDLQSGEVSIRELLQKRIVQVGCQDCTCQCAHACSGRVLLATVAQQSARQI